MPLIPGVNQPEVRPNAANTPYFSVKATEDEFGSNIGKSMLSLGKNLSDDAEAVAKLRPPKDQDKSTQSGDQKNQKDGQQDNAPKQIASASDISDAIDLINGFNGNAFSLQSDFFRLGGKAAVDAAPDVLGR